MIFQVLKTLQYTFKLVEHLHSKVVKSANEITTIFVSPKNVYG
jgi:hypothetical protein